VSHRRPAAGLVAAVVVLAVSLVAGCASAYEPLEVGQCLPPGAGVVGRRAQAPEVVPCSQPHQYEVFARRDLEPPDDTWPGGELVLVNSKRLCRLSIRAAAGFGPRSLPDGVTVVHVSPTESSWAEGDREVECLFRWDEATTSTLVEPDR
jgi:hypothetical protein